LNSLYCYDYVEKRFNEIIPDTSEKYADLTDEMIGKSAIPCGREQFVMEEYAGNLIVFGGRVAWENAVWESSTLEKITIPSINDVWRYNINNNHWMRLFPTAESFVDESFYDLFPKQMTPAAMSGSASVIVDGYLYIFGGRFINGSLSSQLWAFDINSRNWTLCTSSCLIINTYFIIILNIYFIL
jgi:hypothetical protein